MRLVVTAVGVAAAAVTRRMRRKRGRTDPGGRGGEERDSWSGIGPRKAADLGSSALSQRGVGGTPGSITTAVGCGHAERRRGHLPISVRAPRGWDPAETAHERRPRPGRGENATGACCRPMHVAEEWSLTRRYHEALHGHSGHLSACQSVYVCVGGRPGGEESVGHVVTVKGHYGEFVVIFWQSEIHVNPSRGDGRSYPPPGAATTSSSQRTCWLAAFVAAPPPSSVGRVEAAFVATPLLGAGSRRDPADVAAPPALPVGRPCRRLTPGL